MTAAKKRKILVVDDNRTNLALLKVYLQKMGLVPLLTDNGREALELVLNEHQLYAARVFEFL